MERSLKKGVTIFILCCALVAMLGACMTQRNNTVPENQNGMMQRQNTQLQGIENQNALDLTPQTGQTRNPLILNRQNNNGNTLNTTPGTAQKQNSMLNNSTLNNNTNNNANANNNGNNNQMGLVGQMNADTTKSKQIKAQLEKMSGVDDVSVIVLGNTALVGCDIKNDNRTGNTDDLRNKIMQKVKNMDNSITNCVVTDKPEILERIKTLGEDITNGKPGNQITEEFNRIIKSINQ